MSTNVTSPTNNTRDRLLKKFGSDLDLLALGGAISRVVELASSDSEATHTLANCVLSDVALTQKVLRLANTVFYRTSNSSPVTTISRAIFLLGFDTIRLSALTMLLVETLSNNKQAQCVRIELVDALCASLVGRELARHCHYQGSEEASIAALFKNLGRLLVASHEHALYNDIYNLSRQENISPSQASLQMIGCSFDFLTEAVLHEWNMPDSIAFAIRPLPAGKVPASKNAQEWMRQVATFSAEAAQLIMHTHDLASSAGAQALLTRFGNALHIDQKKLTGIFLSVTQEIQGIVQSCDLASQRDTKITAPDETQSAGLPAVLQLATMDTCSPQGNACHASGKPIDARDFLLAGVQDATNLMTSGRCNPADLMLLILETIYSSMGFRFATICLEDTKTDLFRATLSVGENHENRQSRFFFPITSSADLFHLAMENNADLMISDARSPKIRDLLPAWHLALLPDTRSMIILPLVMQKVRLGMFYADRNQAAPEGVPSDETALIKTLKGQLLGALNLR